MMSVYSSNFHGYPVQLQNNNLISRKTTKNRKIKRKSSNTIKSLTKKPKEDESKGNKSMCYSILNGIYADASLEGIQ